MSKVSMVERQFVHHESNGSQGIAECCRDCGRCTDRPVFASPAHPKDIPRREGLDVQDLNLRDVGSAWGSVAEEISCAGLPRVVELDGTRGAPGPVLAPRLHELARRVVLGL